MDAKNALLTVSRGGLLRLFYEQRDGSWLDVAAELETPPTQVDATLTHASFAGLKGKHKLSLH
jgi:hypothetical protein